MSRWRTLFAGAALLIGAIALPAVVDVGQASAQVSVDPACAGTLSGTTYTLTANCTATGPLTIPNGDTLDGAGFSISASGAAFGAVLSNATPDATMNIENLTITGSSFTAAATTPCPIGISPCLIGILFSEAGGSVSNVTVQGMTLGNGNQQGHGIWVRNPTTTNTVNITDTTLSGYQKGGIVAQGAGTTVNVSDSTIGPPDILTGLIAQNAIQYGGSLLGGSGTVSNNTIIQNGSGVPNVGSDGILLFGAGTVTISGNGISGDGIDIGISVTNDTTLANVTNNHLAQTSPNPTNPETIGVSVDSTSHATLSCNTWAGFAEDVSGIPPQPLCQGYWMAGADGGVFTFGNAGFQGSAAGMVSSSSPVVGIASDPSGGYWMATASGQVFNFGAPSFGSMAGKPLNAPIIGIASTSDGSGYYLVAADGGVFSFGDALFRGSMGGTHLNKPMVGMAATTDDQGYYLVAADGGVFSFGDAQFHGSTGGMTLNKPVVGITVTPQDHGYWLVASDGGVFSFDAPFFGSTGAIHLNKPVVGMSPTGDGLGYYLAASDGGVFAFGDAEFLGSMGGKPLAAPVVGITAIGF